MTEQATVRKFRTVQKEGNCAVSRDLVYYNPEMIIAIGYRVRTSTGVQFRQWATERLKEYLRKGFIDIAEIAAIEYRPMTMNDS